MYGGFTVFGGIRRALLGVPSKAPGVQRRCRSFGRNLWRRACKRRRQETLQGGDTDIYIYTHINIRIDTHTYIHTQTHTCIHACLHTFIRTYIHTYIHIDIHTYIHTYVRTYIHTYVFTHMSHNVYTYIYIYIHIICVYICTYICHHRGTKYQSHEHSCLLFRLLTILVFA